MTRPDMSDWPLSAAMMMRTAFIYAFRAALIIAVAALIIIASAGA